MEARGDWPFDESPNVATITTRGVIDGSDWIATVSHDEDDGGWQAIGSRGARMEDAMLVALRQVYERDPSIGEVADLPLGWRACREGPDAPCSGNRNKKARSSRNVQSRDGRLE